MAIADVDLDGYTIPAGEPVLLFTGSASRDEAEFAQPDEVDFDRFPNRHLAFGAGVHRCIGSHLARMEVRVALEAIHETIPTYRRMPEKKVVRHTAVNRGTDELWLIV
jgi:cytochrome P450